MGFLRELVSMIRILQRSLGMPGCGSVIALLVVFRRSAMGLCRKLVLLGGSPMFLVHGIPSGDVNSPFPCTRWAILCWIGCATRPME